MFFGCEQYFCVVFPEMYRNRWGNGLVIQTEDNSRHELHIR